jgi:hypothetical protein
VDDAVVAALRREGSRRPADGSAGLRVLASAGVRVVTLTNGPLSPSETLLERCRRCPASRSPATAGRSAADGRLAVQHAPPATAPGRRRRALSPAAAERLDAGEDVQAFHRSPCGPSPRPRPPWREAGRADLLVGEQALGRQAGRSARTLSGASSGWAGRRARSPGGLPQGPSPWNRSGCRLLDPAEFQWYAAQGWSVVTLTGHPRSGPRPASPPSAVRRWPSSPLATRAWPAGLASHRRTSLVWSSSTERLPTLLLEVLPALPHEPACSCRAAWTRAHSRAMLPALRRRVSTARRRARQLAECHRRGVTPPPPPRWTGATRRCR